MMFSLLLILHHQTLNWDKFWLHHILRHVVFNLERNDYFCGKKVKYVKKQKDNLLLYMTQLFCFRWAS